MPLSIEQQMFAAKAGQGLWPAGTGWWEQSMSPTWKLGGWATRGELRNMSAADRARIERYDDVYNKGNPKVRSLLENLFGDSDIPSWVMDAWADNPDWDYNDMFKFLDQGGKK